MYYVYGSQGRDKGKYGIHTRKPTRGRRYHGPYETRAGAEDTVASLERFRSATAGLGPASKRPTRRRRAQRRRNPVPKGADLAVAIGLIAVAGGIGYYLYTQSQLLTPVASNGAGQALNSKGQIIPTSALTPAQQGALAAQAASAQLANKTAATGSAAAT